MKKAAILLAVCALAVCSFGSCEPKKESISNIEVNEQQNDSYENALKECFNAMYSIGGGDAFYSYMYPDSAVEAMKNEGKYDELINTFNDTQDKIIGDENGTLTFGSIDDAKEISDEQRDGIKKYFVELCKPYLPDVTAESFDIKEGYEVNFNYLNNGEKGGDDMALVVKLNDEGWKIITK